MLLVRRQVHVGGVRRSRRSTACGPTGRSCSRCAPPARLGREGGDDGFVGRASGRWSASSRCRITSALPTSPQVRSMPMRSTTSIVVADRADAGGVDDVERNALDLDGLADLVARGAGDRRDDGDVGAGQRIQQRRLADVRLARPAPRSGLRAAARLAPPGGTPAPARRRCRPAGRARSIFPGSRFLLPESRASPRPACAGRSSGPPACGSSCENAPDSDCDADLAAASVEASIRSATASACARSSLSLRKARRVNSPGSARRRPMLAARFEHARQQHLQHDRAAVALQFQHVFAGVRMRTLEVAGPGPGR